MNTETRIDVYTKQNKGGGLTHRQRRRLVKKAGSEPLATVVKDDGMGYPPSMQGFREIVGFGGEDILADRPVSGAPA